MTYRNRRLLDISHEAPCMLKIEGVCQDGLHPSVPAHSNQLRHGRGVGHKSHDCFVVAACPGCHSWLDTGGATRADKQQRFLEGLERYLLWMFENGKVKVA